MNLFKSTKRFIIGGISFALILAFLFAMESNVAGDDSEECAECEVCDQKYKAGRTRCVGFDIGCRGSFPSDAFGNDLYPQDYFCKKRGYISCADRVVNDYLNCVSQANENWERSTDVNKNGIAGQEKAKCFKKYTHGLYEECKPQVCKNWCKEKGWTDGEYKYHGNYCACSGEVANEESYCRNYCRHKASDGFINPGKLIGTARRFPNGKIPPDSEGSPFCDCECEEEYKKHKDGCIAIANEPPVAEAGTDITVEAGESVILSGEKSYDPDGEIVFFYWRLDGTQIAIGEVTQPRQFKAGENHVTVEVIDNQNARDFDTIIVFVKSKEEDSKEETCEIICQKRWDENASGKGTPPNCACSCLEGYNPNDELGLCERDCDFFCQQELGDHSEGIPEGEYPDTTCTCNCKDGYETSGDMFTIGKCEESCDAQCIKKHGRGVMGWRNADGKCACSNCLYPYERDTNTNQCVLRANPRNLQPFYLIEFLKSRGYSEMVYSSSSTLKGGSVIIWDKVIQKVTHFHKHSSLMLDKGEQIEMGHDRDSFGIIVSSILPSGTWPKPNKGIYVPSLVFVPPDGSVFKSADIKKYMRGQIRYGEDKKSNSLPEKHDDWNCHGFVAAAIQTYMNTGMKCNLSTAQEKDIQSRYGYKSTTLKLKNGTKAIR